MTESPQLARRYAQLERKLEPDRQRSVARGPIGLIAVMALLCIAVATVVAIDLSRLQTARGTALAFTGATVFGDCDAFERLSVPGPRERDERSAEQRCAALQTQTQSAREESARYSIDLVDLEEAEREATVSIRVGRPQGDGTAERVVELPLRRVDGGWVVVRTATVCRLLRCP